MVMTEVRKSLSAAFDVVYNVCDVVGDGIRTFSVSKAHNDKFIKCAASYLEVGAYLAQDADVKKGFADSAEGFYTARTVVSFLNPYEGTFPNIYRSAKTMGSIIYSFFSSDASLSEIDQPAAKRTFGDKHSGAFKYKGTADKLAGLLIEGLQFTSSVSFAAAFAFFRPYGFFAKRFKNDEGYNLGKNGFTISMAVLQGTALVSTPIIFLRNTLIYHNSTDPKIKNNSRIQESYNFSIVSSAGTMIEKSAEFAKSILVLKKVPVPTGTMAGLTAFIGTCSLGLAILGVVKDVRNKILDDREKKAAATAAEGLVTNLENEIRDLKAKLPQNTGLGEATLLGSL